MPEIIQQSKGKASWCCTWKTEVVPNSSALPINGVIEKEPATPLAARPAQRVMQHKHCSVQQLCFPPCSLRILLQ